MPVVDFLLFALDVLSRGAISSNFFNLDNSHVSAVDGGVIAFLSDGISEGLFFDAVRRLEVFLAGAFSSISMIGNDVSV